MRRSPGRPPRRLPGPGLAVGLALLTATASSDARADSLAVDPAINTERGYMPFEELSYEVMVEGMVGFKADVRLRITLHNASSRPQDLAQSLALPRGAELLGLRVARAGVWSDGVTTDLSEEPGRRDPGTVFVRPIPPAQRGDLPGAELIAFNLESGSTTQIELLLQVPPRMRGDRWELELPERGEPYLGMARDRRVLVRGGATPRFWVDGAANEGAPVLVSRATDRAIVAWPATLPKTSAKAPHLAAHYEVMRDPSGEGGSFRLYLRLGASAPVHPDHVVVAVDRSRSTDVALQREAFAMVGALLDTLPSQVTFDALTFARTARPLLGEGPAPKVGDEAARARLGQSLGAGTREQGTDLSAAFTVAGEQIKRRGAKRPLILVITDGMLPLSITPAEVEAALARGLGHPRKGAEILFAVDEPILARRGLDPDHPVARMAAGLGARISLETLAQLVDDAKGLLEAPQVLRDLTIELPPAVSLAEAPPRGLVAGNFLVLEGVYDGARPPKPRIKGTIGGRKIAVSPRAEIQPSPPEALVASVGPTGVKASAAEGYATPPWVTRNLQRAARLGIMWAGRGNGSDERGHLDERIFRRYLATRVFPRARACYNRALTRDQTLGGRVHFEIEVGKGEVIHARMAEKSLSRVDAEFESCLTEAAWALDIPAGKLDDQLYRLRYPLVFNPPTGGRPPVQEDPQTSGTIELLIGHGG
ncbi:MAG: hypothetical protein R3B09_14760 [Nannocystaceae bacterium]